METQNENQNKPLRESGVSGSLQLNDSWGWGHCDDCAEWDMCPVCKEKDNAYMNEMLAECYADIQKEEDERRRIGERLLRALESIKGKDWVEQLRKYAKDCECHFPFSIVRKPKGHIQESDCEIFGNEWVEQFTGYECDDYYGTLTIQVDEKRYLEMPYRC